MNFGIINNNGDIYKVFPSLKLAQLYYGDQGYEESFGFKIVFTYESVTKFPLDSYYANWNN